MILSMICKIVFKNLCVRIWKVSKSETLIHDVLSPGKILLPMPILYCTSESHYHTVYRYSFSQRKQQTFSVAYTAGKIKLLHGNPIASTKTRGHRVGVVVDYVDNVSPSKLTTPSPCPRCQQLHGQCVSIVND